MCLEDTYHTGVHARIYRESIVSGPSGNFIPFNYHIKMTKNGPRLPGKHNPFEPLPPNVFFYLHFRLIIFFSRDNTFHYTMFIKIYIKTKIISFCYHMSINKYIFNTQLFEIVQNYTFWKPLLYFHWGYMYLLVLDDKYLCMCIP